MIRISPINRGGCDAGLAQRRRTERDGEIERGLGEERKETGRSKNRRETPVCIDAGTAVTKGLRHPRSLSAVPREILRVCARVQRASVCVRVGKYTI